MLFNLQEEVASSSDVFFWMGLKHTSTSDFFFNYIILFLQNYRTNIQTQLLFVHIFNDNNNASMSVYLLIKSHNLFDPLERGELEGALVHWSSSRMISGSHSQAGHWFYHLHNTPQEEQPDLEFCYNCSLKLRTEIHPTHVDLSSVWAIISLHIFPGIPTELTAALDTPDLEGFSSCNFSPLIDGQILSPQFIQNQVWI